MMEQIITVTKINWIDIEAREADVFFNLNNNDFRAFCHPCNFKTGEIVSVKFGFIEDDISDDIMWSENKEGEKSIIKAQNSEWSYYCYGQIKEVNPTVIDCGSILFCCKKWHMDKSLKGAHIYFVISRLDIISL